MQLLKTIQIIKRDFGLWPISKILSNGNDCDAGLFKRGLISAR